MIGRHSPRDRLSPPDIITTSIEPGGSVHQFIVGGSRRAVVGVTIAGAVSAMMLASAALLLAPRALARATPGFKTGTYVGTTSQHELIKFRIIKSKCYTSKSSSSGGTGASHPGYTYASKPKKCQGCDDIIPAKANYGWCPPPTNITLCSHCMRESEIAPVPSQRVIGRRAAQKGLKARSRANSCPSGLRRFQRARSKPKDPTVRTLNATDLSPDERARYGL